MTRLAPRAVAAAIVLALLGGDLGGALAQDRRAIVAERRAAMKAQGDALAGIKRYLDGAADQGTAARNAGDLVALARAERERFPPGTSTLEFPGESGAKPLIWSEWDKFLEAQQTMVTEAIKLETAIKGGDKIAASAQFRQAVEAGCVGCHRLYREKAGLPF